MRQPYNSLSLAPVQKLTTAEWRRALDVIATGTFLCTREFLADMIARGWGRIVQIASSAGLEGARFVAHYSAAKHAVVGFTRSVALEVAGKGVRVNAVNPGVVVTSLHRTSGMDEEAYASFLERSKTTHPLGRVGQPEEVAELIFFLASPKAGWITGLSCSIDGGRSQTCAR